VLQGGDVIPSMTMLVDDADFADTMYAVMEAVLDGHSVKQ